VTRICLRRSLQIALLSSLLASIPALTSADVATDRVVLPDDVTPERYEVSIIPDAAHLAFKGVAGIVLNVHRPTTSVTLNAADLTFQSVAVSSLPGTPRVSFDAAQERATLRFASPIAAGRHLLRIAYTGMISDDSG